MKHLLNFLMVLILALSTCCSTNHLITNKEYMEGIDKSFNSRKALCAQRSASLFSVFDKNLSLEQEEALKFLYAYMPLNDLADYTGEFFLANVNMSLKARTETIWGKRIPEDIFLHYVLPCRVNNENLDSFRIVYYDEIMNRIRAKDIQDAALEINHWCHEKVTYQAADERTSAPMSTILSARGRCGEESTFTVAALRAAGIPARQVYTPRWAHCDDNHAWVEIWDNGNWFYMGACEPEPTLDFGWFTEPARRAMLVHTKSFGAPLGKENAITEQKNFTDVNNLAKYALTKTIFVKVLDNKGIPVENAKVEYQLYNYAEFYPLAIVPTNSHGLSHLETGLGDLLIWAHENDDFNFRKISVAETDTLTLVLDRKAKGNYSLNLDLDVPIVRSPLPVPSPELAAANSKRIDEENSIRRRYTDSWPTSEDAKALAAKLNIDSSEIIKIVERSMGNYREIIRFLSVTADSLKKPAVEMLQILADKDLRDTKETTLSDHLRNCVYTPEFADKKGDGFFIRYILNPRIANEIIVPWRSYFRKILPGDLLKNGPSDPSLIVQYLNRNIKIDNDENYYNTPITPVGVNELKVSDADSRAICFVAICRTLGIPSRLEPGQNVPQYFMNDTWNDVFFSDQKAPDYHKGYVKFISYETKPVPEYYINFTLARFANGRYNTLEYDFNKKVNDFKDELALPTGNYMLVTGNRMADGKVLSGISFFDLSENEHKTLIIRLRKNLSDNRDLGTVDLDSILSLLDKSKSIPDNIGEKGAVIIWIDPEKEPSKHVINDLALLKNELDEWGGEFLLLTDPFQAKTRINSNLISGLPSKTYYGNDNNMESFKKSVNIIPETDIKMPVVLLSDKNGKILFSSTGYKTGIGEQILKNIN
jgi:hypothetical protein